MKFWKEHAALRMAVIAVSAVVGLVLTFTGWKMTGQLNGLWTMLAGLVFLLVGLYVYNKPFQDKH